jgi:hypothetical protein
MATISCDSGTACLVVRAKIISARFSNRQPSGNTLPFSMPFEHGLRPQIRAVSLSPFN